MRVLDTYTGQFVHIDPQDQVLAILSHTWDPDNGEQTFQELQEIQKRYISERGASSQRMACKVARETGFRYLWIDSCCINRESSSELSEAINSMYAWYGDAGVCYAYLADVPPGATPQSRFFRESRWFMRGWTLQELIAPDDLIFLNADWEIIGWKDDLFDVLEKTTGIDRRALLHETELEKFSVAQRFSWASMRETERVEDRAYSLMGIFDINMPILYGEGERALRRLQEEILRRTPDQSLFAW
ncbi:heterokaryon incompatibility protein-domain-containing protein, partial [Dichomitus squalens]